ncbi:LutC/YkgG family protein [Sphingomonas sp. R1]|uniref:LutC/YkgG family protein n=1 Tax=Sphingomonas sp. R1 TaxID=399176 RepID=UPI002223F1D3|nr:LUD domain-containing protein [Sphingomonas sp. R1]UYY75813.1 LUD domain-containing protein [Sphingomonas sp. R1]
MSARDAILARLGPARAAADLAAEAAALLTGEERERPAGPEDLVARFLTQLGQPSVAATHARIGSLAELPGAVAAYLAAEGAEPALWLPPDARVAGLDWAGLTRLADCPIDDGTVLAFARAGVAETGSLVFETAPEAPMLPNFLALRHIVLLEVAGLVRWLEDAVPGGAAPRAHYWVTGVSGTTDIEGTYVRGAHGPRFLHVVLVG